MEAYGRQRGRREERRVANRLLKSGRTGLRCGSRWTGRSNEKNKYTPTNMLILNIEKIEQGETTE